MVKCYSTGVAFMRLDQLINQVVGYNNYYEGVTYPYRNIKYVSSEICEEKYLHNFEVKDKYLNKVYKTEIKNNGGALHSIRCNCERFRRSQACPHIATVLYFYSDEIFSKEYVNPLEASLNVLNLFVNNDKKEIKEKLNLDFEFEFHNNSISLKLFLGVKKLYTLNDNKFYNFMRAYRRNRAFEFGKNFTYDPNKHYFDKEDKEIFDFILNGATQDNYYMSPLDMNVRDFESILSLLKNRTFKIAGLGEINAVLDGMPTKYKLEETNDNFKVTIEDFTNYHVLLESKKYVVYKHNLYILNEFESNYLKVLEQQRISSLEFKKETINKFGEGLFRKMKGNIEIDEAITDIDLPKEVNTKLYFDILYSKLKCQVKFDYSGKEVGYSEKSDFLRDKDTEDEVYSEMLGFGFREENKELVLADEEGIYSFLDENLSVLAEKYEVFTSKKIDSINIFKKMKTNNNFSIGEDGILSYKFDVEGLDSNELNGLFKALKAKKKYYKLKNNNVVSLNENEELSNLNALMQDLEISGVDIENGSAEIPKYRALYIDSLKNNRYKDIKTNNLIDDFIKNFAKYKDLEVSFDKNDSKVLRDYQKEGVRWLTTIYKCDLGGILADEMGLGKSVQTISFIKQILEENKDAKILIVAPTSLIYNWQKEFEKFGSDLKYVVVAENKAKRLEVLNNKDKYNIFITTYGLIRNDNDEYENMDFELCVIDEAQTIKNYQAGMTREIKKIKSKCKVALTGTPVENNITELWSIFDFIMPGYLNSLAKFKEKYNVHDVAEEDLEVLKTLSLQIKPFILRRKKSEVAESLPDKIENKIYIELPKKQKLLYMKELEDTKREMDEIIATEGFLKSRIKLLQLLTKLRQICIDPSVMYENYDGERAKIEELINIVKDSIENGHKMLIFSSFKRVLKNVQKEFEKEGISSYMIDGDVKNKERVRLVDKFNEDDTSCFLITLKAGGTGLNLVGADTVIHLDIWWNPSVEDQATDRAHRIGQTKKVTVLKLVTKGTIEERIIELQEKKKVLRDNLIEGHNSEALSSLTEKDIKDLLAYTEE